MAGDAPAGRESPQPLLLPPICRRIGWPLSATGAVVLFVRHGLLVAPEWLNLDVFAVSSLFVQRKTFGVINNNVMDEMGVVLLVLGVMGVIFSREAVENEGTRNARLRALTLAAWAQAITWLLVMLFTFGLDFFAALMLSLAVFPIVFRAAFLRSLSAGAHGGG